MGECVTQVQGVVSLHRRQKCNSSCRHGSVGRGIGLLRFSFGPLCSCGEEDRGCGRGRTKFTHLPLYLCYSQGKKQILQNFGHHRESLPTPNQLFVASWFLREVSCLAPPLFLFLLRFGNTDKSRVRGRAHALARREGLPV